MWRSELPSWRVCISSPPSQGLCSLSRRQELLALNVLRRELPEHLDDTLVQVLFIFFSVVGHGVLGAPTPDQLLGFAVVHVDNQGSFLVVLLRSGCFPYSSESSPTPSSAHTVIESLKRLFGMRCGNRHDGYVAAAVDLSPALGGQLGVDCAFDPRVPKRVRWLDCLPGVGFVLREIGLVIKVGFDLLCERVSQHKQEEYGANCCTANELHWASFLELRNAF